MQVLELGDLGNGFDRTKMAGFSIFSGGSVSNLNDLLAKMTADNHEEEVESEEFAQYVKHPNTVDAVLIDPFDKTWNKVALPLEIEVDEDEVCQFQFHSWTKMNDMACRVHIQSCTSGLRPSRSSLNGMVSAALTSTSRTVTLAYWSTCASSTQNTHPGQELSFVAKRL